MTHKNKPGDGECFDCRGYRADGCDWVGWPNFRCQYFEKDDLLYTAAERRAKHRGRPEKENLTISRGWQKMIFGFKKIIRSIANRISSDAAT